jgi:hypothetical protein
MTHDSAVRTIVKLAPEIEKSGAEKVLLDYAEREDLPVAQLEKLAQVYNTLRTVTHIERADDKGDSFELLDVPMLAVGYATGLGKEKAASRVAVSCGSHDPRTVDLRRALSDEIAGPRQLAKAAAAPVVAASAAKEAAQWVRELVDTAFDLEIESRLEMAKLASEICRYAPRDGDTIDLSGPERDAIRSVGSVAVVKAAAEWLSSAVRADFHHHDFATPVKSASFAVSSTTGSLMTKLAEAVSLHTAMQKVAQAKFPGFPEGSSDEPPKPIPGITGPPLGAPPTSATATATADVGGELAHALENIHELDAAQADGLLNYLEQNGVVDPQRVAAIRKELEDNRQQATEETEKADGGDTAGSGKPAAGGGAGGGGDDSGDSVASGKPRQGKGGAKQEQDTGSAASLLGSVYNLAAIPVRSTMSAINTSAAKADEILTRVTSKARTNEAQKATDRSVDEIRRAINIRRMLATDPVLREADPKEVLEIYNSVARMNPEIADNMPAMKLLLREAVSYEGVTLDAQKQLADIRRSSADAEGKEAENTKRRYMVGDALPISITTKA